MRQPANPDAIERLIRLHTHLMELFRAGKLKMKVTHFMRIYCQKEGVSLSTFYAKVKSE